MASSINASTTAGVVTTADTSGVLNIQTAGTTAIAISASQAVSFTNAPTVTGGTANGVAFLNGSKVLTTGSALVFDGTNLGIGTSSPAYKLTVEGTLAAKRVGANQYIGLSTGSGEGYLETINTLSADYIGFYFRQTNNSGTVTRATLDSSGNLGLGVAPSTFTGLGATVFESNGGATAYRGATSGVEQYTNTYFNGGFLYKASGFATRFATATGTFTWFTAPSGTANNAISFTQAMTLDASGNLLVGTTSMGTIGSSSGFQITPSGAIYSASTGDSVFARRSSDGTVITFRRDTTSVGRIDVTTTATSYVTSSDYRLKNTIAPMTGALAKVAALKPVTYKWNSNSSDGEGFIAHELAEVCPHAVSGQKDAVDEDGNPQYQGIDTSFLVATLTAAIKEQQALITQLQADVALLKGA